MTLAIAGILFLKEKLKYDILGEIPIRTVTLVDSFGGHKIGRNFVFHTGSELICSDTIGEEERNSIIFRVEANKRLVVNEEYHEKTLLEILRVVADGIEPARVKGGKVLKHPPKCGLLLTGEYYIGSGSDAARLMPVEVNNPISSADLWECQKDSLALSTFCRFYIQWYVNNYGKVVEGIKCLKENYLKENETGNMHARIREMQFCLETAYRLYLLYRSEKKFITD